MPIRATDKTPLLKKSLTAAVSISKSTRELVAYVLALCTVLVVWGAFNLPTLMTTHGVIIKAASFNVRYDPTPHRRRHHVGPGGEHGWDERLDLILDQTFWEQPDIIGFQEVLSPQFDSLIAGLGSVYGSVGVGRDDGDRAGEAVPIFWRSATFEAHGHVDHFWLSETPDVPGSISWDAGQTRMATRVTLRHRDTGRLVHAVCTHFDDRGPLSRGEAGKVILARLSPLLHSNDLVILMGDLNSEANELGYQTLTMHRYDPQPYPDSRKGSAFLDTRKEFQSRTGASRPHLHAPYGEHGTFTDFLPRSNEKTSIIDFILTNDLPGLKISKAGILPNLFGDGIRLSDHRMVVAVLEM